MQHYNQVKYSENRSIDAKILLEDFMFLKYTIYIYLYKYSNNINQVFSNKISQG